jgi:hypothetical protein
VILDKLFRDVKIVKTTSLPKIKHYNFELEQLKASSTEFYMKVNDVAEFVVRNGNEIFFKPITEDDNVLDLYLNGSIFGVLLEQRGFLSLHSSCVQIGGKTILVAGESGFGKSSLAYFLSLNSKNKFLADDICAIKNERVFPFTNRVKLWEHVIHEFNIHNKNLKRIKPDINKYYVEIDGSESPESIDMIFHGRINDTDDFKIEPLHPMKCIEHIHNNLYWKELVVNIPFYQENSLKEMAKICSTVQSFSFERPKNAAIKNTSEFLLNFIENYEI